MIDVNSPENLKMTIALLGAFASAVWFLFWRYFSKVEKSIDEVKALLTNTVTRPECQQRHADLTAIVTTMLGITCKRCKENGNGNKF